MRDEVMKTAHFVPDNKLQFMNVLLQNNNICSVFGLDVDNQDICSNPTIQSLVKECRACKDQKRKEKWEEGPWNKQAKFALVMRLRIYV